MKRIARALITTALVVAALTVCVGASFGGLIGSNFYATTSPARFPDVAFGSVDGKYLVVWPDYNYSPSRIFGRFVSNSGSLIGSPFQISDGSVYALYPTAAFNSTNNEFLVTWDDGRGDRVAGQRVRGSDGALLGGNFTIGTTSGGRSSVAWSSGSNCYLVVYYLAAGSIDVYGQRVSNTGTLVGSEMNVSNDAYYSGYPSVGYAPSGNLFLVTWDYSPDYGYIDGQRIDASTGAFVGGRIPVSRMGAEDRSNVAYDSVNNRWIVQFNCQANAGYSYDQYAQIVKTDGTLHGGAIAVAHTTAFEGETLLGCDIAAISGRFFGIFQQDSNFAGREILPSGALPGGFVTLGSNTGGHGAVAADNSLGRFLAVWESFESNTYYVRCQLYQADTNPPPGPVTNLIVASGDGQNNLTWTNPVESDFTATMVRFKTNGYPTSPTDGTLLVDKSGSPGAADGVTHSNLTNGVTYYYTAFAHDSTPNYALPVYGSGTPTAPICFSDSFSYADGSLNGNGGWSGSAGSNIGIENMAVKILGGATAQDAIKTVTCGDPGSGYITVVVNIKSGTGTAYAWDLWIDDPSNLNLARWYGAGTTARGRIGSSTSVTATQTLTGGWDTLRVKIDPYANTTQFFFNETSIGTLDHGQTGAGNTIGRLRFTRGTTTDANGSYLYFDNLTIGESDTVAPGPVTNLIAAAGDQQIGLSWTNPSGDFTGTMIRFKTTGFPTSPTDGTLVVDKSAMPGSNDSHSHTGLTNGTTYYYSAFAHDAAPNYASAANASATAQDATAPGNVTNFTATSGDTQNALSWGNPGDSDFAGVKIMFKTNGYPTGPTDGTQCYSGTGTGTTHTGLTNGVTYYYKAFSFDEVPNYSTGAQTSAIPADVTAPGSVTGFSATAGDTENALAWTNPGDADFAGTMIRFKTTGYPTGPADGTQCYSGTGTGTTHTGLTNGVTYYYAAFAYDEAPNYASAAQADATPEGAEQYCFVEDFAYTDGNLNGNGGWSGSAASEIQTLGQVVKMNGGAGVKDAVKTVSCSDPGTGYILVQTRIQAGTGTNNMWGLWINDASGANLARWYGAGTNARGRIGGTADVTAVQSLTGGWDTIAVKIYPATNNTEFFFNGTSIGTLSHSSQGAGDSVGMIKFERMDNAGAAGNSVFFDVLSIGESSTETNDSQIISDTIPTTMTAGQQYQVNVTVKNIGTTTWTAADGYKLGAVDDTDPFADGRQLLSGTDSIGPDQQKTFTFTMTAPSSPGQYTTDWKMVREGVEWFGGQHAEQVQVDQGTVTISNSAFDSGADGWSISVWKAGPYENGTMAWNSSAGRTGGGMRCSGSGSSDNNDRCTREGGEIQKTISTSGYSNITVSYDLKVNALGSNRTGAGNGSCTVDHSLIDEQITVFYSTNGGSNWTEAEWLKRSDLLGSYQSYGTRVIDLTGVSAVDNNPDFRLRFRWQVNSMADVADLDNIKVISN